MPFLRLISMGFLHGGMGKTSCFEYTNCWPMKYIKSCGGPRMHITNKLYKTLNLVEFKESHITIMPAVKTLNGDARVSFSKIK